VAHAAAAKPVRHHVKAAKKTKTRAQPKAKPSGGTAPAGAQLTFTP
jgi:hypothetical protein